MMRKEPHTRVKSQMIPLVVEGEAGQCVTGRIMPSVIFRLQQMVANDYELSWSRILREDMRMKWWSVNYKAHLRAQRWWDRIRGRPQTTYRDGWWTKIALATEWLRLGMSEGCCFLDGEVRVVNGKTRHVLVSGKMKPMTEFSAEAPLVMEGVSVLQTGWIEVDVYFAKKARSYMMFCGNVVV